RKNSTGKMFSSPHNEVDALLSENEMLQGKLHSQEEDFRLQNSTLMTELSKLCTQIEQLEQENQSLKKEDGAFAVTAPASPNSLTVDEELLRLQAENSALQKKMKGGYEAGLSTAVGWSAALCPITHCFGPELEMALNTEQEEKRLLREQGRHLESPTSSFFFTRPSPPLSYSHRFGSVGLFLLICPCCPCAASSRPSTGPSRGWPALQVASQSAVSQEQVDIILQENDALRTNLAALEQIQTVKTQEMNLLREQQETLTCDLQQVRVEQERLLAQRDDLNSQLQESSFANRKLLEQLTEEGQEKDKLLREMEEVKKTAEKRKTMLDDMAMQLNQEMSVHKEALSDLKLQHEKEVLGVRARYEKELRGLHEEKSRSEEEIRQQLREEKARSKELECLQPRVDELKTQLQSMEGTRGWFERRLKEAEVSLLDHQEEIKRLQRHEDGEVIVKLKQVIVREMTQRGPPFCSICQSGFAPNQQSLCILQEIKDTLDGQRILEKKGSAARKDLKRQLHLERKRADKLQERLQEILTNSKTRTGLEELVLSEINSPSRTQQTGDSSSVSSFSYRDIIKEAQPTIQNKVSSPQSQRPAELSDDEVGELFQRLAEVQREKWMLEEKVKHLEVSCSSMAEDICRKSAIIETYVMDSRRDVSGGAIGGHGSSQGLGSVLRDLVKPGDENVREMNKKLQHMLEEQLTKNMHLQKDLEVLSQELVRLSKDSRAAES
uniref:GRIP1 associated protein 1 n=1 Tax=Cynoglossus semilaevis TaxID=244447 RepID=A0A3P8WUK5_CYNSE